MRNSSMKWMASATVVMVALALIMAVPTAAQAGKWGFSVGPGGFGIGYGGGHHGHHGHHGGYYGGGYGGYYGGAIYAPPVYGGYYAPAPYYPAYVGPVYGGCYGPSWGFSYWD